MQVNQPQVRVTIAGAAIPDVVAVEVEQVGYFSADRFILVFAIGATGASYFSELGAAAVTISAALLPFGFTELLTGQIDHVRVDLLKNTATVTGRDFSARLIDTEISATFANQTASQIAVAIAARHGLTPNVTATATPVGQYYELDHARSALGLHSRAGTEWNLLSWLALIEDFALSVTGTTLNFCAMPPASTFALTPQNCIELDLDTIVALPAMTSVKSWSPRNKAMVSATAGSGRLATTLIRPNLTSQQAQALAATHLAGLRRHQTILQATMPGELTLTPGSTITLSQTNSKFDQAYLVDTIRRSIDAVSGFTQTLRAHAAV